MIIVFGWHVVQQDYIKIFLHFLKMFFPIVQWLVKEHPPPPPPQPSPSPPKKSDLADKNLSDEGYNFQAKHSAIIFVTCVKNKVSFFLV